MTTEQIIASNITEARKQKGLTQEQLAEKIGIMRASLVRIESGKHSTRTTILFRISGALNINISELLKNVHQ